MARRRGDIPPEIEVLDAQGAVISVGERVEPEPPATERERRPKRWVAGVLLAAIAAAAIAWLFAGDDDPDPIALDEPAGVVASGRLDVSAGADDATFPLFGLDWDHELLVVEGLDIEAIDLNTGRTRLVSGDPDRTDFVFARSLSVVDGEIYLLGGDGLYRAEPGGPEPLFDDEERGFATQVVGDYVFDQQISSGLGVVLRHLGTDDEFAVDGALNWAAVGADVLYSLGATIYITSPDEEPRRWADGELVLAGANGVVWRTCEDADTCRWYYGTPEDSRVRAIPDTAGRSLGISAVWLQGTAWLGTNELLSPGGRFAWTATAGDDPFEIDVQLVDLASGEFALVDGPAGGLVGTFDPSERLLLIPNPGAAPVSLVAVDVATGERRQLRLTGEVSATEAIGFLPDS